jgi:hypothetical protein
MPAMLAAWGRLLLMSLYVLFMLLLVIRLYVLF